MGPKKVWTPGRYGYSTKDTSGSVEKNHGVPRNGESTPRSMAFTKKSGMIKPMDGSGKPMLRGHMGLGAEKNIELL